MKNHESVIIGTYNELPLAKSPEIVSEQRSFPSCSGDLGHYPIIYIFEKFLTRSVWPTRLNLEGKNEEEIQMTMMTMIMMHLGKL